MSLIGAGPGDPGLLTLRGAELLQQADVVAYDHLVSPSLLRWCPPTARRIYVGKQANRHTATQTTINRLLIRVAKTGKRVVRLKGGDPFLFGRGGEEALELTRAKVPYEVVPGVTSALAVPAYAGIPVTHRLRSSSLAVVTGHEDPAKPGSAIRWDRLATACDTLVCLMGVGALPAIVDQLRRHGRSASTPAAVIEWGTTPRQRTVAATLSTIAGRVKSAGLKPPAILVVGDVVSLRARLNWFETRPLFGRRIVVTRAVQQAASLARRLEVLGAEVRELPAIELSPVPVTARFRAAVQALPETDWVFFTSPEGIGWFRRMLAACRKDLRWLKGCHIGAIGPKTAQAIEALGIHVDFVPRQFNQETMVAECPRRASAGARALIFSAEGSRDVLEAGLRRRGMAVERLAIYRTMVPQALLEDAASLGQRPADAVTVTSASCVEHLAKALRATGHGQLIKRLPFASIGPVTSKAVRRHGARVLVEAKVSTIEGLLEALVRRWK